MRILTLLVSTSLLAISTAAHAEVTASAEAPKAVAKQAEVVGTVTEIVVTANRREERLQTVPVTVTVVGGEQLTRQNINTVEDLQRSAPALNLAGPAGFGAVSIRGIGNLSFSRSSEGSVGVVVDGVSLANSSDTPPLLFDIARAEVLEGPQGTLFGRNSSAGVINIVTNAPNPARFEAIAHADVGSRDNLIGRLAVNVPVSANSALRVTGSYDRDPQVQRNLRDGTYNQHEGFAGRARFLWEPNDKLKINLGADYTQRTVDGGVGWAVYSSSATSLLTARLAACGVKIGPENEDGCISPDSTETKISYGFSAQADYDLGGPTLTAITAYRGVRAKSLNDVDSTLANRYVQDTHDTSTNFSQELRIASPNSGSIQYVAGLYFFHRRAESVVGQVGQVLADLQLIGACPLPVSALCGLSFGQYRPLNTAATSYAAFGQATVSASDRLRFILGARVGREDVRADVRASGLEPGAFAQITPGAAFSRAVADTYLSYRVGIQYDLSRDLMTFATYTRGYKGPAVNDGASDTSVPLIVRPEIPKSIEVGFKATLAHGRAAFNGSAFYTDVTNFQSQFWNSSIPAFVFGNAPKLTSKGFTANLFGRPIDGLTANIGVTYTDATYGAGYNVANYLNNIVSAEGKQLGTPKWKITASGEYNHTLTSSLDGFAQADVVYHTKTFSNSANDPILAIDGSTIFGGRIGIRTKDGRYGLSIFARNLFDTFRPSYRFATPVAAQQLDPAAFSQFSSPEAHRIVGVSLDAKY